MTKSSGRDSALTTPFNNDRNSSHASSLIIRKNATVSNTGDLIFSQSKGAEGTTPSKANSEGITEREREIILQSNTKYLFRITSRDNGNIISYCGEWYEHTNKNVG